MTDTTDDREYGPDENYADKMLERREASMNVCKALAENSPLEKFTPAQMHEANNKGRILQDGLRGALMVSMSKGGDPILCFYAALEALITVFSTMEQTTENQEAVAYLMAIANGVRISPEGPLSILNGELYLAAVVDTKVDVPKDVRARFGLPEEGEIKPGGVIKPFFPGQKDGGNVIDASELFRSAGKPTTVH